MNTARELQSSGERLSMGAAAEVAGVSRTMIYLKLAELGGERDPSSGRMTVDAARVRAYAESRRRRARSRK